MGAEEIDSNRRKLTGWKMIGRYLGRSERAVQFWEEERGLPIHRIPGGRGQTVFAYAAELDTWMHSRGVIEVDASGRSPAALSSMAPDPQPAARPPGILVLPCDIQPGPGLSRTGDSLCQQLIVRLSALQPVRVLSWTTARSERQNVEAIEATAQRLNVRYLVETSIERGPTALHIDVRVIDAEIDQIVLANRFVVAEDATCTVFAELAEGVALHFALVHAGALVEPICLEDMTPTFFLEYLAAARCFFDDGDGSSGRALRTLDRVVAAYPAFDVARALRGLALVQVAETRSDAGLIAEARGILASLGNGTGARVTVAFLGAAIDRLATSGEAHVGSSRTVLRWIPPSVVRHGRLYERRSTLHRASDAGVVRRSSDDRHDHLSSAVGPSLLKELLQALMTLHRCNGRLTDPHARAVQGGPYPRAVPSANDSTLVRGVFGEGGKT